MPPLVATESNKPLSIALEEISEAKVEPRDPEELVEEEADPLAFMEGDGEEAVQEVGEEDVEQQE